MQNEEILPNIKAEGAVIEPSLSLCITTYNRAPLLEQALHAVLSQIDSVEALQVEVLVLDNASVDNTPEVVERAKGRSPHVSLRYVRHSENLGMDRNFLEAIRSANGEFVFLLSDDDILLPSAVAKLLALIQGHPEIDNFSLNARSFLRDPAEMTAPPGIALSEDLVVKHPDAALQVINSNIGFMSILAFRKSLIEDRLLTQHYQDMVGTCYLECYVFLDALFHGRGLVVTAQPLVAMRTENCTPWNYFRVFVTEMHNLMAYAERMGFSHKIVRQIEADNLLTVRHYVSRVKIYGRGEEYWRSQRDAISRLFRVYHFHPYLWLVIVPLMFFPRSLRPVALGLRRLLGRPDVPAGRRVTDLSVTSE